MSAERVAVITSDGTHVHCGCAQGTYDTLCGIDANDDAVGHFGRLMPVPDDMKIDCAACKAIFTMSRKYKASDFV